MSFDPDVLVRLAVAARECEPWDRDAVHDFKNYCEFHRDALVAAVLTGGAE